MEGFRSLLAVLLCCHLSSALTDCVNNTGTEGEYLLCVGRPKTVEVGHNTSLVVEMVDRFPFWVGDGVNVTLNVSLAYSHLADLSNEVVNLSVDSVFTIYLQSLSAGRTVIKFKCINLTSNPCPFNRSYTNLVQREVYFARSHVLTIITAVVGWIYFASWSAVYLPQIFLNFYRRSVTGLNFDFLALDYTGTLAYMAFNAGLFWAPAIQHEYFLRHLAGVIPVQLNDVIFSIWHHFAVTIVILQCFIFERGSQKLSYTAVVFLLLAWLTLIISAFVAVDGELKWLDYLYVASYVKLVTSVAKYVPQVWFNCRRKSTVGWSIGFVLLDITGGSFSILQMFLLSYNYDDWTSIFGDPTKFLLGAFSVGFDLLLMLQHYVLFRHPPSTQTQPSPQQEDEDTDRQAFEKEASAKSEEEEAESEDKKGITLFQIKK